MLFGKEHKPVVMPDGRRKPMMAGNWKMNNTIPEAVVLAQEISNNQNRDYEYVDIVMCPPFVDLKPVYSVLEFDRSQIMVGAQDVYWEEKGAYTGEISVGMLAEIGCEYCIVGHSERRELFGETDTDVNRKVKALIAGEIHPIVCVGESLSIRDAGTTNDFICSELSAALAGLDDMDMRGLVVAYEPIWAIGTGHTATPEQAQDAIHALREQIARDFGQETADTTRILYGGSMKPANVEGLMAMEDIDGGLIGGASLVASDFRSLISAAAKTVM